MRVIWKYLVIVALVVVNLGVVGAAPIDRPAFERLWQRTATPIQRGVADYSWVWGPEPFTPLDGGESRESIRPARGAVLRQEPHGDQQSERRP